MLCVLNGAKQHEQGLKSRKILGILEKLLEMKTTQSQSTLQTYNVVKIVKSERVLIWTEL